MVVELQGLELHGHHGVLDEEAERGQRFLFDLRLDVGDAGLSDDIDDAVDYRDVVAVVREISDGTRFQLLEALAAAVADALLTRFPVAWVQVRARKPDVRLAAPVEHAAVVVERARGA